MEKQLRQLENVVEVIGTLKTIDVEFKTSRKGQNYFQGKMIINCSIDNIVYEQIVKIMAMANTRYGKYLETALKEFKDSDSVGEEHASRIKVLGALELIEYQKMGEIRHWNEVKALNLSKMDDANEKDRSVALIETVIENISDNKNESGEITGDLEITCFTVGWNSKVIPLLDVKVDKALAASFKEVYKPKDTVRLYYNILSGTSSISQNASDSTPYFGTSQPLVVSTQKENYINRLVVYAGDKPRNDGTEYTSEEIEFVQKTRKIEIDNIVSHVPTVAAFSGFGNPI